MSEPIAEFETKYRDHPITVNNHPHDGIASIDLGGAVVHGDPRIEFLDEGVPNSFQVWDRSQLVLSEYLETEVSRRVHEAIESADI